MVPYSLLTKISVSMNIIVMNPPVSEKTIEKVLTCL